MRILLTGGTGDVGVATVRRLMDHGHDVTVLGRRPANALKPGEIPPEGAGYVQGDVEDYTAVRTAMTGHDTVVHLAAIRAPLGVPGRDVFRVNTSGTFNVFEAAAECGISRVVTASSINAFGYFFGDHSFPLRYLPVDEAHAGVQTDAYSFSKIVLERIGEYFWERDGISSVALRLPAVLPHDGERDWIKNPGWFREMADEILGAGEESRLARVERMTKGYDEFRSAHRLEYADDHLERGELPPNITKDELQFMSRQANFFTWIDEIDSAQSIELGLTAEYTGAHALYVNSRHNSLRLPVEEIAKLYWPPVPEIRPQTKGDDCVVSIDRARELIGFDPEY
ncbi:MAG: NAD-dependent epimerase/dehydratase family protein [Spirochaetota bacterium]